MTFGQGFGDEFGGDLDLKPTDVIHWEAVGAEVEGAKVTVGLRLTTSQNFSLYTTKVTFKPPEGFTLKKSVLPDTKSIIDPIEQVETDVYTGGDFILTYEGLEPFKKDVFPFAITFLGCTERICLFPYTLEIPIQTFIKPVEAGTAKAAATEAKTPEASKPPAKEEPSGDMEQAFAEKIKAGELSLPILLLALFLGGLLTNATPCVFPMIPITIRILGNQGSAPWLAASVYALGIVVTYTALGIVAALSGGMFGSFMASTAVNVVFAALFIALGMTMLGFGDLSKLQTIGSKLGSGKSSLGNTLLMGAGAGLVAAPCTGPILGALLAMTAQSGDPSAAAPYFFIYSLGFALPYVFLGSLSGKASVMKVSPRVQVGVKLFFAAAMFGLSAYYLRVPLHGWFKGVDGSWAQIAAALSLVGIPYCLYILFKEGSHKFASIAPTFILGIGLFATTQWLTGKDLKPEIGIFWLPTIEEGLHQAQETDKPILVDGWAEWCEACKKMDKTTYQSTKVRQLIKSRYVAVKLDFTNLDEELEAVSTKYGMQGLPVTLILPPDGDLKKGRKLTGYVGADQLEQELTHFQSH